MSELTPRDQMRDQFDDRAKVEQKERLAEAYRRARHDRTTLEEQAWLGQPLTKAARRRIEECRDLLGDDDGHARQCLGESCIDSASVKQSTDGREIWIRSQVGPPQPRLGFERKMLPPKSDLDFADQDLQRLHAQGPGTGFECDIGISFGAKQVNQVWQNHGVERFIRERFAARVPGEELFLTTVVKMRGSEQSDRYRFQRIEYQLDGFRDGQSWTLFSAQITEDTIVVPRSGHELSVLTLEVEASAASDLDSREQKATINATRQYLVNESGDVVSVEVAEDSLRRLVATRYWDNAAIAQQQRELALLRSSKDAEQSLLVENILNDENISERSLPFEPSLTR